MKARKVIDLIRISVGDYYRMPDLYKFDNFAQCSADDSLYCVANSFIKPDESSSLYNQIKEFSSHRKIHLRHDKLQRGLCIKNCESKVLAMGNQSDSYFVANFSMDSKVSQTFNPIKSSIQTSNLCSSCSTSSTTQM
jgi:hypothetical protein